MYQQTNGYRIERQMQKQQLSLTDILHMPDDYNLETGMPWDADNIFDDLE